MSLRRAGALFLLVLICLNAFVSVESIKEAEEKDKKADMDVSEMQRILDTIPTQRMINLKTAAKKLLGKSEDAQFQQTLMELARAEGLLDSWNSNEINKGRPNRTQHQKNSQQKASKKPTKKEEPLDALLGLAKQYLGQDKHDPTLDIMANMASAYMKNNQKTNQKSDGGLDLDTVMQMASLFSGKGSNGGENNPLAALSSLLGNSGMDVNRLLEMGSALMSQSQSPSGRKVRSPVVDLVAGYVANFFSVDSAGLVDVYEALVHLYSAQNWREVNTIMRSRFGTDAETYLNRMADEGIRLRLSESATDELVAWVQHFLDPVNVKTKIFYVNAFLLQYNFPAIDHKNIIDTLSVVVDKIAKVFAGREIHSKLMMKGLELQLKSMLGLAPSDAMDLRNYSAEDLAHAVRYYVKSEFFDPLADIWSDFQLASRYPKCAETIICDRNAPQSIRTSLGLKKAITRSASTILAWTLEKTNIRHMPAFDLLYQASWQSQGNCHAKYKEDCKQIMKDRHHVVKLGYEHYEL